MDELGAALDLGPENEEQLAHLRRALILGSGFQLVLVEVSQPGLRSEVLRRLLGWSGQGGVPALTVVKTRPGGDPVAALRGVAVGTILMGIDQRFDVEAVDRSLASSEEAITSPTGAGDPVERSMTTLNWHRDELPLLVRGPLVMMLSPDGLRRLFVHAPDLLAWRAHTTRVMPPRPIDIEVRPWPSRRASLEEKAWLERMIAAGTSNARGPLARGLPGWLIRLGEIEAREGGPWEKHFARAEELAAGRRDILFRLELAKARRALDEERHEDAEIHEGRAADQVPDSLDTSHGWESTRGTLGRGAARREPGWVTHDAVFAELRIVRAERLLRIGEADKATEVAKAALRSARASGDLALVIAALGVMGAVASHHGDHADATSLFGELREVARVARDPAAEAFALTRLVDLASDIERARPLFLQVMAVTQDEDHEAHARACLALVRHELMTGAPDEAERILSDVAPLQELQQRTRMRALIARGRVATARGQHGAALAAYQMVWDEQELTAPVSRQHARIGVLLGEAALHTGNTESARIAYRRVAEIAGVLADTQLAAAANAGLGRTEVSESGKAAHRDANPESASDKALAWIDAPYVTAVARPTTREPEAETTDVTADPELAALEAEFIDLDAPGDAPERLDLLDRLARAYMRIGRRRDANLCHARAIWESPQASIGVRLGAWIASELGGTDTETIDAALDPLLAKETPQLDDVRLVAALAAHASEPVARDPQRVQRWLDRFDDELDARTLWLARLGLARLSGGNPRHLAHIRDRILVRLASGSPPERELPAFLRIGGRGGALGLANGELLSRALEDLVRLIATRRRRSPFEAPSELTNAYAAFQLGYGFARIGRHERARELAAEAAAAFVGVAIDPVHKYLSDAFQARIEQAIAGLSPEMPLPDTIRAQLASLSRMARYKVDWLRNASRILEPVVQPDPIGAFSRRLADFRGAEFAALDAITDVTTRAREVDKILHVASTDAAQRERLVAGVLDVLFELPEAQAVSIFERTWPLITRVEKERRATLYAEALVVVGHFGRVDLVPELLKQLDVAIRVAAHHMIKWRGSADLDRVLEQSLRALRRIGLRKEIAELLAKVERAMPRAHLRTRLALAAGIAFLGDLARATPTFEQAHETLGSEMHWRERVELIRALATAYSHTPVLTALSGIARLAGQLSNISDNLGINSHYSLSVLHFVDSLVMGITSDDLALGETRRRFVEDDEHLIRRRLQRDLSNP